MRDIQIKLKNKSIAKEGYHLDGKLVLVLRADSSTCTAVEEAIIYTLRRLEEPIKDNPVKDKET